MSLCLPFMWAITWAQGSVFLVAVLSEFECFYVFMFFWEGSASERTKAAVTLIPESSHRRFGVLRGNWLVMVCGTPYAAVPVDPRSSASTHHTSNPCVSISATCPRRRSARYSCNSPPGYPFKFNPNPRPPPCLPLPPPVFLHPPVRTPRAIPSVCLLQCPSALDFRDRPLAVRSSRFPPGRPLASRKADLPPADDGHQRSFQPARWDPIQAS